MPDATSDIYIDASFFAGQDGTDDVVTEYEAGQADNIGARTTRVVFTTVAASDGTVNVPVVYTTSTAISGVYSVPLTFFAETSLTAGSSDIPAELFLQSASDGQSNVPLLYTRFPTISGYRDQYVAFTGGTSYPGYYSVPLEWRTISGVATTLDRYVDYTNFTGSYAPGQIPIPTYSGFIDVDMIYQVPSTISGKGDTWVDITFNGWVRRPHYLDIRSTVSGIKSYRTELTTVSGAVWAINMELAALLLTTSGITTDIFCALTDYANLPFEAENIVGGLKDLDTDIYSTAQGQDALTINVDLYSLKISNFSLEEGQYTGATGFISVDITDDECPVSTSGTYLLVDGVQVTTTLSGITDGYRMFYDPVDDFASLEGPTTFTVHAENECGDELEKDYFLTFGYIVEMKNSSAGMDFGFENKVVVRVTAEDYASCPQVSSLAWDFESAGFKNRDLGASIIGLPAYSDTKDLSAEIQPHSTAYFYGKEFTVVINAKDFAGNEMTPFVLKYRIEDA